MSDAGRTGPTGGQQPRGRPSWGVLALVLLTGVALVRGGSGGFDLGPPRPSTAAATHGRHSTGAGPTTPEPLPFSPAERVRIPAIRVDAPVTEVALDAQGWVTAPPPGDPNLAGWFTGAVSPGERGTAVVVGHVDDRRGPAVFYGLGSLREGSHVEVGREDGRTAVFRVYGTELYDVERFPGTKVYGSTGAPELRVITCGGPFSERRGYRGNVVVFARLVSVR